MTLVFQTMGTVASIRADYPDVPAIENTFDRFDRVFSLYRPDSELSRIATGSLALVDSTELVRDAYAEATEWSRATAGAFTAHRPDGVLDLSGIVKALAMDAAGLILDRSERPWSLGVGGDVLTSRTSGTEPRSIGITDPADRARLLTTVALNGARRAVATSGSSERGDHIWGADRNAFAQVTVIADDIVTADVLATAMIAGGRDALDSITSSWDIDVLAIGPDGEMLATPGFTTLLGARR